MADDYLRPHLDPFATPSGTVFRFALIIVSASAIALTTLSQVTASWLGVAQSDVLEYQSCMMAREPGSPHSCHDPRSAAGSWPAITALTLFWFTVFAIYWLIPTWRIRRRRLHPLGGDLLAEATEYLRNLQREVGIETRITYLLAPLNPRIDGLAFGRVGRRHIVISGGLAALYGRDIQAFRTVLLHELAHLRNRDLDMTFVTVAIWRVVAFLLIFRLFAASVNISLGRFPDFGIRAEVASSAATALLAALVPLARNAVLRSRELYADARAILWTNGQADLERLFDDYSARGGAKKFGRLIRLHPPLEERRKALTDASSLFAFGFWDALAIGAAATLSNIGIREFLSHPTDSFMSQVDSFIAGACAGALLAAGVQTSVWRVTMRRFARQEPIGGVDGAGVGMCIGIGAAGLADPTLATLMYRVPVSSAITIIVSWWLVVLLTGWLIVRWSASATRSWVQVTTGRRSPTSTVVGVAALATVPITIWLYVVTQLRDLAIVGQMINPDVPPLAIFLFTILIDIVIYFFPVLLLILSLVLIPLIGRVWARRQERGRTSRTEPEHP